MLWGMNRTRAAPLARKMVTDSACVCVVCPILECRRTRSDKDWKRVPLFTTTAGRTVLRQSSCSCHCFPFACRVLCAARGLFHTTCVLRRWGVLFFAGRVKGVRPCVSLFPKMVDWATTSRRKHPV